MAIKHEIKRIDWLKAVLCALVGLAITVVCMLTFPAGLLGLPVAVLFFVPILILWAKH